MSRGTDNLLEKNPDAWFRKEIKKGVAETQNRDKSPLQTQMYSQTIGDLFAGMSGLFFALASPGRATPAQSRRGLGRVLRCGR